MESLNEPLHWNTGVLCFKFFFRMGGEQTVSDEQTAKNVHWLGTLRMPLYDSNY